MPTSGKAGQPTRPASNSGTTSLTHTGQTFLGCRAALASLRGSAGGAIVNIDSITGIRGTEAMIAYSASKSDLVWATPSSELDLAKDNIRLATICSDATWIPMVTKLLSPTSDENAANQALLQHQPIGRTDTSREVASIIAFPASDDASFMRDRQFPCKAAAASARHRAPAIYPRLQRGRP